jgi:hypothetical protein
MELQWQQFSGFSVLDGINILLSGIFLNIIFITDAIT